MFFLYISQLLTLIHIIYSFIPVWNFYSQSVDLLSSVSSYNYTIYESTYEGYNVKLEKK